MKKLITIAILFITTVSYTQIPNPSFEDWYYNEGMQRWDPVGWEPDAQNAYSQSSAAVDGTSSVKYDTDGSYILQLYVHKYVQENIDPFYYVSFFVNFNGFQNASVYYAELAMYVDFFTLNETCRCDINSTVNVIPGSWQQVCFSLDCNCIPQDSITAYTISGYIRAFATDPEFVVGPGSIYVDHVQISSTPFLTPFIKPWTGDTFIAGETDTIKWDVGEPGQLAKLEYSTDDGANYHLLDQNIPVDTGMYIWEVPDSLLTAKARVRLTEQQSNDSIAESGNFTIKPYILTRINSNGDLEAYDNIYDRWNFENSEVDMWPAWYYNQINYSGIDPFTGNLYDHYQGDSVFAHSLSSDFPDWESFVRAYSIDACYWDTMYGIYNHTSFSASSGLEIINPSLKTS